jgi:hypothetical protein
MFALIQVRKEMASQLMLQELVIWLKCQTDKWLTLEYQVSPFVEDNNLRTKVRRRKSLDTIQLTQQLMLLLEDLTMFNQNTHLCHSPLNSMASLCNQKGT